MKKIDVHKFKKVLGCKFFLDTDAIKAHHAAGLQDATQAILCLFIAALQEDNPFYMRLKKIGETLGIPYNSVKRAIKSLVQQGLISRTGKKGGRKRTWAWGQAITSDAEITRPDPSVNGSVPDPSNGSEGAPSNGSVPDPSHKIRDSYKSILEENINNVNVSRHALPLSGIPEIKETNINLNPSGSASTTVVDRIYKHVPKLVGPEKAAKAKSLLAIPTHDPKSGLMNGTNVCKLFLGIIEVHHGRIPLVYDEKKEGQILFNRLKHSWLHRVTAFKRNEFTPIIRDYVMQMKLDSKAELYGSALGEFIRTRMNPQIPPNAKTDKPSTSVDTLDNQPIPIESTDQQTSATPAAKYNGENVIDQMLGELNDNNVEPTDQKTSVAPTTPPTKPEEHIITESEIDKMLAELQEPPRSDAAINREPTPCISPVKQPVEEPAFITPPDTCSVKDSLDQCIAILKATKEPCTDQQTATTPAKREMTEEEIDKMLFEIQNVPREKEKLIATYEDDDYGPEQRFPELERLNRRNALLTD